MRSSLHGLAHVLGQFFIVSSSSELIRLWHHVLNGLRQALRTNPNREKDRGIARGIANNACILFLHFLFPSFCFTVQRDGRATVQGLLSWFLRLLPPIPNNESNPVFYLCTTYALLELHCASLCMFMSMCIFTCKILLLLYC